MKRTAADFLNDARKDDPYELELPGRKTPLRPRAYSQFTHDEQGALLKSELSWNRAVVAGSYEDFPEADTPFILNLRTRFGRDFDAFWKVAQDWPKSAVLKLIDEIDEYYDPTPADDKQAAADPGSEAGKAPLRSVGR